MSAIAKPAPRGACPGALRPMESGDGLIVRVRPHAGAMPLEQMMVIAEAADRYGNGEIDVTRRANLQIRGLRASDLEAVQGLLDRAGLLDASPGAEAIRNIIVSPLTGLDTSALIDVSPVARALEHLLVEDQRLWTLPPKFGFVIDDGGPLSLDAERADVRLRAIDHESFALGLDRPGGIRWIGRVTAGEAAAAAASVAAVFAASPACANRFRLRDAPEEGIAAIAAILALVPLPEQPPTRPPQHPLGLIDLGGNGVAVALGVPFGRLTAGTIRALAKAALASGAKEIILSPWRTLYVPLASRDMARAVLASAARYNFLTKDGDPIFRIDACPGAPACASAATATRSAAHRLAAQLPALGIRSAHISGCPKGCARSAPADLVLVAGKQTFGVVRNGRADGAPEAQVSWTLDDLPARLRELSHG